MIIIWILLAIIVLAIIYVISTYNSLINLKNKVKDQWSQIEIVLKRRADLIPNLVETVKGYATHEKETLDAVINARNKVTSASNTEEEIRSNNELSNAIGRLFAVAEAYPELKANTNFMDLQAQLKDTEDKITYSRQFYNDSVLIYQNKLEVFPSNIIAKMFNFSEFQYFKADEKDKETPQVKF